MWIVVFVTLVACLCAAAAESQATETQLASCRIVTDKLVATANATVTRALKGVCTTGKWSQIEAILSFYLSAFEWKVF